MWVFFGLKCAKLSTFNLYFATTDVVALMGLSMRLDTIYFIKNWKLIAKNTVTKYFLLLQITIHLFLSLGWSMNSAMNEPKIMQGK